MDPVLDALRFINKTTDNVRIDNEKRFVHTEKGITSTFAVDKQGHQRHIIVEKLLECIDKHSEFQPISSKEKRYQHALIRDLRFIGETYDLSSSLKINLCPSRSIEYLPPIEEMVKKFNLTHEYETTYKRKLTAYIDQTCSNGQTCAYRMYFFPQIDKPGPVILSTIVSDLLVRLPNLITNGNEMDEYLDLLTNSFELVQRPEETKICICCLCVQNSKLGIDADILSYRDDNNTCQLLLNLNSGSDEETPSPSSSSSNMLVQTNVNRNTDSSDLVVPLNQSVDYFSPLLKIGTKRKIVQMANFPFSRYKCVKNSHTNTYKIVKRKH